MKQLSFFSILTLLSLFLQAQDRAFLTFGGDKNDFGEDIIEKENGDGFLIAGTTRSYGNGSSDFHVIGTNEHFLALSETQYGGPNVDILTSMIRMDTNEYILFGSSYDFKPGNLNYNATFIDESGNFIDRKVIYKSYYDYGTQVIKTAKDEYAVLGMALREDVFGQSKLFTLKRNGDVILQNHYGTIGERDYGFDIIQNKSGFLILSTYNCDIDMRAPFPVMREPSEVGVIQINKKGEVLWEYKYEGDDFDYAFSFVELNEHIFVAMNTRSGNAQSFDIRILKLSLDGELLDEFNFGGPGFEYAYKIIADSKGDLLLCGTSSSNVLRPSFYAVKFTEFGNLIWERTIEAKASIYTKNVIERSNGDFVFVGSYQPDVYNSDIFVLQLDSSGNTIYPTFIDGIPKVNLEKVQVYPNPTTGLITINPSYIIMKNIRLYDIRGKLVFEQDVNARKSNIQLNFSSFGKGMFILDIIDDKAKHHQKKISLY